MNTKKRMMMIATFLICVVIGGLYRDIVSDAATITDEYIYNLPDVETDLNDEAYADAKEWKITSAEGFNIMCVNSSKLSAQGQVQPKAA